ncbi:Putative uncharacterized transposon-derived protein F52C9.6 [Eumeta japonica]|uniref:Uncharacterized transposon-derived protein F52C9.6 n=1 Tax=Eumeta variegata TaxID=151549 RepID=A0A4C1W6I4_EUMVA|nr:Putative uncharacterized transposon-derived protein F52C9.6 [Eumeta japonica]
MSPMLDEQQAVEQAGFRRGFSTIDNIHIVKRILEKYNEYNKNVYITFIGCAKAFDISSHSYIWDTLEHQGIPVDITVNEATLEFVNEYTYLSQLISPKDLITKEINTRITNGWKKYRSLKEIMKSQDLGMALKTKTFNTCILPCLTYGCETWSLTKSLRDKLAKCQRAIERSRVGTKCQDRARNTDIRMKNKLIDILLRIDQQKWT